MYSTVVELERSFSKICNITHEDEWSEDHLTLLLMRRLRDLFSNRVIQFTDFSKIVDWQSFKNTSKILEKKSGDISIIVNIQFSSGEVLRGVANIEAKRDFQPFHNFKSVSMAQIDRIHWNLPYSQLLLYTRKNNTLPLKFPSDNVWHSHFWISPMNTARQLLKQTSPTDNWKVLRTSIPFSLFLTTRLFWGLDLDFRTSVYLDAASGAGDVVSPSFLAMVNVYYENQKPLVIELGESWREV